MSVNISSSPGFIKVPCAIFMDIQGVTKILMSCCYMQVVVTKYTKSSTKSFLKRNDTCCLKTTQSIPFQKKKTKNMVNQVS